METVTDTLPTDPQLSCFSVTRWTWLLLTLLDDYDDRMHITQTHTDTDTHYTHPYTDTPHQYHTHTDTHTENTPHTETHITYRCVHQK